MFDQDIITMSSNFELGLFIPICIKRPSFQSPERTIWTIVKSKKAELISRFHLREQYLRELRRLEGPTLSIEYRYEYVDDSGDRKKRVLNISFDVEVVEFEKPLFKETRMVVIKFLTSREKIRVHSGPPSLSVYDLIAVSHILCSASFYFDGRFCKIEHIVKHAIESVYGKATKITYPEGEEFSGFYVLTLSFPSTIDLRQLFHIESLCLQLYGLSCGDEGYHTVPIEYAQNRLKQWKWTTRVYFLKIISPNGIILLEHDVKRIANERILLPREDWRNYIEIHEPYTNLLLHHGSSTIMEWICFAELSLRYFSHIIRRLALEIDVISRRLNVKEMNKIRQELLRLKMNIAEFTEMFNPRNISKIPEASEAFNRLFKARGVEQLTLLLDAVSKKIEDYVNSISTELQRVSDTAKDILFRCLAILISIVPFVPRIYDDIFLYMYVFIGSTIITMVVTTIILAAIFAYLIILLTKFATWYAKYTIRKQPR